MPDAAIDSTQESSTQPNQPMVPAPTQQAPQVLGSAPAAAPAQAPAQPNLPPPVAHAAKWGLLAKSLLGQQTSYTVDPKTGQTVATNTPTKPGDIWRHIVAGAMLGGAAAEESKNNTGFFGGFSTGGNAVVQDARNQDLLKRKQAQEQFQNQQEREKVGMEQERLGLEKSRFEQEKVYQSAQIAQWTVTALQADHELDLQNAEFVQKQNEFNTSVQLKMIELGAQELPIPAGPNGENINGKPDNGADIQKYMSDPKNRQAPNGFTRLPIMTVDTNGLHRDPKTNQWLDADNKPTSLNDRTTWHVYQIPQNTLSQPTEVKGSVINKMTGSELPPNATYRMPLTDYLGLATKAKQEGLEKERIERGDRLNSIRAQYDAANVKREDATRELTEATNTQDESGIAAAKAKMTEAEDEIQATADQMADIVSPGSSAKRKAAAEESKKKVSANIPSLDDTKKTTMLDTARKLPKDQAIQQIKAAKNINDADKKYLIDELNKPQEPGILSKIGTAIAGPGSLVDRVIQDQKKRLGQ